MIRGVELDYSFNVIDNIHHSVILGHDFCTDYGVNIDFPTKTVSITLNKGKTNEQTIFAYVHENTGLARTTESVTIPKRSETIISVSISK